MIMTQFLRRLKCTEHHMDQTVLNEHWTQSGNTHDQLAIPRRWIPQTSIHLTCSSPAPKISPLLHSCPGLATNWAHVQMLRFTYLQTDTDKDTDTDTGMDIGHAKNMHGRDQRRCQGRESGHGTRTRTLPRTLPRTLTATDTAIVLSHMTVDC